MADEHPYLVRSGPEICWMCGVQLSTTQMVADGGSACLTVRWYCLDTHECTERWTTRRSRPAAAAGPSGSAAPPRAGLPQREAASYERAATL